MATRRGPGRPAGQRARTDSEVNAAGAQVFRKLGYHRATMEDVAAELDMTKGSLYHYVSTKEELLYRVLLPPYEDAVRTASAAAERAAPAPERIAEVVERHLRNTVEHYPAISIYVAASNDTPIPEEMRELDRRYTSAVRRIIIDGMREGTFRVLDPSIAMVSVLGTCNWFAITYDPRDGWDIDEFAKGLVEIVLRGLTDDTHSLPAHATGAPDLEGTNDMRNSDKAIGDNGSVDGERDDNESGDQRADR
ncbi:MAG: TetR/AcrR family transcriptional regulator [Microthrixaceae bacterium]